MSRLLSSLPPALFAEEGERAASHLTADPVWKQYRTVLLFLSMDREIGTGPLLHLAVGDGKKVFVPRVEGDALVFYRIHGADGPWDTGAFNIREPRRAGALSLADGDLPALIVAPGLAFDRKGGRLGRGKGYYDRFLRDMETRTKTGRSFFIAGFCMDSQIVPSVPAEDGDYPVDALCSGEGFFPCTR